MNTLGVVVRGLLRASHVYLEGSEVPLAYDGKVTRSGQISVDVNGPLDMRWLVAGWRENPFSIELFKLDDTGEIAQRVDTITGELNHSGVSSGEKHYD
jgi:hypothetical protein